MDLTVGLQESKTQTGIKKAVKMIIKSAIPSMPRIALELAKTSQFILQNNWKFEEVGSNIKRSKIEKLKISKDQNNAKFRWNHKLVFSTNNKTITAKKGSVISKDNIKNKFKDKQGFNLFIWKKRKGSSKWNFKNIWANFYLYPKQPLQWIIGTVGSFASGT